MEHLQFVSPKKGCRIIFISGEIGIGKSSLCQRLVKRFRAGGKKVSGVISPAVFENGQKIAINAVDLSNDEIIELAAARFSKEKSGQDLTENKKPTGTIGAVMQNLGAEIRLSKHKEEGNIENNHPSNGFGWNIHAQALEWGNQALGKAMPTEVLFIDELGPLEFQMGAGWMNGLKALDSGQYKLALLVVRPGLLHEARRRWPEAGLLQITGPISEADFEGVKANLSSFLK